MSHNGNVAAEGDRADLMEALLQHGLNSTDAATTFELIEATARRHSRDMHRMRWHVVASKSELAVWWDDGGDTRNLMYVWPQHVHWAYGCAEPDGALINAKTAKGEPCHYFPGFTQSASGVQRGEMKSQHDICGQCGMQAPLEHDGQCELCGAELATDE